MSMQIQSLLECWLLGLWAIALLSSASFTTDCTVNTTAQGAALVSLYHTLHGETWGRRDGWLDNSLACPVPLSPSDRASESTWPAYCCWYGITCCAPATPGAEKAAGACPLEHGGGVMKVSLKYNNLTGPFPNDALTALSCSLTLLDVNSNALTGTISSDLGPLEPLQSMNLGYNKLSGTFPQIFGAEPMLRTLTLDFNAFTGYLPPDICPLNHTFLTDVSASNNQFLALVVYQCTSLISLVGDYNPFGAASAATEGSYLDLLSQLHILRISNADMSVNFSGSGELHLPELAVYSLSGNRLRGSITDNTASMANLLILDLARNPFLRGTLPQVFSRLLSLKTMDLSSTAVYGTIPDSWSTLADLGNIVVRLQQTLLGCCFNVTYLDEHEHYYAVEPQLYVPKLQFGPFNLSAKHLPEFLEFTDSFVAPSPDASLGDRHMMCPETQVVGSGNGSQSRFIIDPMYFMYEGCKCEMGYTATYVAKDPTGVFLTCTAVQWDHPASFSTVLVAVVTVVPAFVALLMAALVLFLWRRMTRERHLTLFGGKVRPPLATLETTLLVTDIEDSTVLWEKAPLVMDQAVVMHHDVIRRCVLQHGGYESATEGDSFLLAFHTAPAAVRCAVAVQAELLECEWPQTLYGVLPGCARMYAAAPDLHPADGSQQRTKTSALYDALCRLFQRSHNNSSGGTAGKLPAPPKESMLQLVTPSSPSAVALKAVSQSATDVGDLLALSPRLKTASISVSNGPLLWLQRSSVMDGSCDNAIAAGSLTAGRPLSRMSAPTLPVGAALPLLPPAVAQPLHATVHDYLLHVAGQAAGPAAGSTVMLFSGLRVRMGMATGMDDLDDVFQDRAAGRMTYRGAFMAAAKAVTDAAQGGNILISEATFDQLPSEELLASHVLVAHMGEHRLKGFDKPMHIYAVVSQTLLPRLALLSPLRTVEQLSSSFLSAPFRRAAIAFMTAAGKDALMAWNKEVAQQSMDVYHSTVQAELSRCGGYLVQASDGLCLAAFGVANTDAAIRWAVCSIALCLTAQWPAKLYTHELGEKVVVSKPWDMAAFGSDRPVSDCGSGGGAVLTAAGMSHPLPMDGLSLKPQILFAGLRVKCGIDVGEVVADVHAVQGRMTYRGRVMNRAARIGAVAKSGQVWCSRSAWDKAGNLDVRRRRHSSAVTGGCGPNDAGGEILSHVPMSPDSAPDSPRVPILSRGGSGSSGANHCAIRGLSLGPYRLKGVGDMELVHCVPQGDVLGPLAQRELLGTPDRPSHSTVGGGGGAPRRLSRVTMCDRESRDSSRSGLAASLALRPVLAEGVEEGDEGEEDEVEEGPVDSREAVLLAPEFPPEADDC